MKCEHEIVYGLNYGYHYQCKHCGKSSREIELEHKIKELEKKLKGAKQND